MKTIHTINLSLTDKARPQSVYSTLSRPILYISVIALSVFVISYIVSFIILSYFTIRLSEFNRETDELIGRIEANRDLEAILLTEKDKLARIEKITSLKLDYTKIVNDVDAMMTPGMILSNIDILVDGTLTAELLASSSADLSYFVDNLENRDIETSEYTAFGTSSIERKEEGRYIFAVSFRLKNEKDGKIQ